MSELSHSDKARLKADYPGLYIVALTFDDMKVLRGIQDTLYGAWCDTVEEGEEDMVRNEMDLVKQIIKDAES